VSTPLLGKLPVGRLRIWVHKLHGLSAVDFRTPLTPGLTQTARQRQGLYCRPGGPHRVVCQYRRRRLTQQYSLLLGGCQQLTSAASALTRDRLQSIHDSRCQSHTRINILVLVADGST